MMEDFWIRPAIYAELKCSPMITPHYTANPGRTQKMDAKWKVLFGGGEALKRGNVKQCPKCLRWHENSDRICKECAEPLMNNDVGETSEVDVVRGGDKPGVDKPSSN